MMKKLISIILSICMLLSLVVLPVNVFATESEEATYEGDTYYKFTFGENGTAYQQAYDSDDTLTYKENTYNPIVTSNTDLSASASVKTITDEKTGDSFGVLDIEHSETPNQQIWVTLLKEDGTPFELEPNSSYTIKYEIYSSCLANGAQGFFVGGSHNSRPSNHSSLYTQYGTKNGKAEVLKAITRPVQTDSALYGGAIRYNANETYTSASGDLYVNATHKLVTLNNGSYNSETGSLSFEHPTFTLQSVRQATPPDDWETATYYSGAIWNLKEVADGAEFEANKEYHKSTATGDIVTLNNYLAFFFDSSVFEADTDGDGTKETLTNDFCIKSVEIYKDGVGTVEYNEGNGNVVTKEGNVGEVEQLYVPTAVPAGKYFTGWYTDAACTTEYSNTTVTYAEGAPLKLYAGYKDYLASVTNDWSTKDYAQTAINNNTILEYGYFYHTTNKYYHNVNGHGWGTVTATDEGLRAYPASYSTYTDASLNSTIYGATWSPFTNKSRKNGVWNDDNNFTAYGDEYATTGWGETRFITAYREDGTPFIVKPNTKYKITITYKVDSKYAETGATVASKAYVGIGYSKWTPKDDPNAAANKSLDKRGSAIDYNTATDDFVTATYLVDSGTNLDNYIPVVGVQFTQSKVVGKKVDVVDAENGVYVYKVVDVPSIIVKEIKVEEVAEVTFSYKNGTTSKVAANKGEAIEYPVLVAEDVNNVYDAVWSLSSTEYVPVPPESDGKALTVYEFRRTDKQSFESYNQEYELVNNKLPTNATITDEEACEGSKSMKYDNRNLQLFENHWQYKENIDEYWPKQWTNCFSYDAETDVFTKLTGTEPDFEYGKYYIYRSPSEPDQGMFMVKGLGPQKAYTYNYKITFKYYVPEVMKYDVKISTKQISTENIYGGGTVDLKSTFVIPKTATKGWQTGKLYVSATAQTAGNGGQAIAFKVDTATITYDNARNCVVYFDDIVCENYTPTPTVIYHHNDGVTEDLVITEDINEGINDIDYVPTAPEGKYFMGWFTDEALTTSAGTTFNVPTSPSSGIQETDLYAKWGNYADGDIFNFEDITNKPATGYAYMKDGVYSRVDGIIETGWAYKSFTADGVVLGKGDGGNAYKWDSSLEQTEGDHVQTESASDLVAVAAKDSQGVGEQYKVGWGAYSNYIVKDANGNAIIAKPNTKYAVLMTYEVLASGPVTLHIGMGRNDAYRTEGAKNYAADVYNSYASTNSFTIGTDKLTGETDTFTYYINTGDFTGVAPVVSIHCKADGYLGERLATDYNGVESYQVDGVTYYPHKIVSAPKVAIKEITLIEIEGDNPVVTYKYYEKGEGFNAVIKDAPVGSPIDVPTNNVDPNWYSDKAVQSIENISKYPSANTTLYNADYMMAPGNVVNLEASFFGTQFEKRFTEKDGQNVPAIYFNSVGYDESTQMFRMGKAEDGHTYKVSFSIKADKFEADMGVHFASGIANNMLDTTTYLADYDDDIKASKVVAGDSWYDFTYYVTYDAAGYYKSVPGAGMDDTKESVREYFYIWFSQTINAHDLEDCDNAIYIADIVYEDLGVAVGENGASVLHPDAMKNAKSQAMRFYFTYETEDGSTIKIGNEEFKVVERGFIYQNGAIGKYTADNGAYTGLLLSTAGIATTTMTEGFENCWDYKDGTMTFSTYVKGFTKALYGEKLIVRGYVTFEASGKRHTVYSDTVNRSVNGITDAGNFHPAKQ